MRQKAKLGPWIDGLTLALMVVTAWSSPSLKLSCGRPSATATAKKSSFRWRPDDQTRSPSAAVVRTWIVTLLCFSPRRLQCS